MGHRLRRLRPFVHAVVTHDGGDADPIITKDLVAPRVLRLLAPGGVMLPIQNGGVARVLADGLGEDRILGGFSNLGATMVEPGVYEQKNAGHLVIGELAGGVSERIDRVARTLGRAIEVKASSNISGAIWSKLLNE